MFHSIFRKGGKIFRIGKDGKKDFVKEISTFKFPSCFRLEVKWRYKECEGRLLANLDGHALSHIDKKGFRKCLRTRVRWNLARLVPEISIGQFCLWFTLAVPPKFISRSTLSCNKVSISLSELYRYRTIQSFNRNPIYYLRFEASPQFRGHFNNPITNGAKCQKSKKWKWKRNLMTHTSPSCCLS